MKNLNVFNSPLCLLVISILLLPGCTIIRNVHNDKVDLAFMNNKGEVNLGLGVDINDETTGLNGSIMFCPADNILLGFGYSNFSYKFLHSSEDIQSSNYDFDTDHGQLKGYKFRGNVGYFNHFGNEGTGYLEAMLTMAYGANVLRLNQNDPSFPYDFYEYNPLSIGLQCGVGKQTEMLSLMGGIKVQTIQFRDQIPIYRTDYDDVNTDDNIFIFDLFYGMRFGKGPVKGLFQIGIGFNPNSLENFVVEPLPNISLGMNFAFGRKK